MTTNQEYGTDLKETILHNTRIAQMEQVQREKQTEEIEETDLCEICGEPYHTFCDDCGIKLCSSCYQTHMEEEHE